MVEPPWSPPAASEDFSDTGWGSTADVEWGCTSVVFVREWDWTATNIGLPLIRVPFLLRTLSTKLFGIATSAAWRSLFSFSLEINFIAQLCLKTGLENPKKS